MSVTAIASIEHERTGRIHMRHELDSASGKYYLNIERVTGLQFSSASPTSEIFLRVCVLPSAPTDLKNVASVLFNIKPGPKVQHDRMRGRTELHPIQTNVAINEEFNLNIKDVLAAPDYASGRYRLHIAVVATGGATSINSTHAIGSMSFVLPSISKSSKVDKRKRQRKKNETTDLLASSAMQWYWFFSPSVGVQYSEVVEQIASPPSSPLQREKPDPIMMSGSPAHTSIRIHGRQSMLTNVQINDVYCWVPASMFSNTWVYRGETNALWLYFHAQRMVWAIGTSIGSMMPIAYIQGHAAEMPGEQESNEAVIDEIDPAVWQVFSVNLESEAAVVDMNTGGIGTYFGDPLVTCTPF